MNSHPKATRAGGAPVVSWRAVVLVGAVALSLLIAVATIDYIGVQARTDDLVAGTEPEFGVLGKLDEIHDAWRLRRSIYLAAGAIVLVFTGAGVAVTRER